MPQLNAKSDLDVVWLHTHLNQWNGGVRHIYEVAKRLNTKCRLTLVVGKISPEIKQLFIKEGITIEENVLLYFSTDLSRDNLKHWIFFDYYLNRSFNFLKKNYGTNAIFLSSHFPLQSVTSRFPKSIYMFFEPCAFLYDNSFIGNYSFMKRVLLSTLRYFFYRYDKSGAKKSSQLLTVTKFSAKRGEKLYGRLAEPTYCGVNADHFKKHINKDLAERYYGSKIILHSASYLSPVKGTHFLILALPKIVAQVPNCKLLILSCCKNTSTINSLFALADTLGVKKNVEFLPFISEEDLPAYYSMADVVVQPSINESFRLPIHEANACETPCICFSGGSADEEIINGQTGFIVPFGDIEALAKATVTILQNSDLRNNLGITGKEQVQRVFNWEKTTKCVWNSILIASQNKKW
jgi:glycosyltransferase involved in cell wall biosynthesis